MKKAGSILVLFIGIVILAMAEPWHEKENGIVKSIGDNQVCDKNNPDHKCVSIEFACKELKNGERVEVRKTVMVTATQALTLVQGGKIREC